MEKGKSHVSRKSDKSSKASAKDTKTARVAAKGADVPEAPAAAVPSSGPGFVQKVADPNVVPVAPVVPAEGQPVTTPRDVQGEVQEGAKFKANDAVTYKGLSCRVVSLKENGKTYSLMTADGRHSFDVDESELELASPSSAPK